MGDQACKALVCLCVYESTFLCKSELHYYFFDESAWTNYLCIIAYYTQLCPKSKNFFFFFSRESVDDMH